MLTFSWHNGNLSHAFDIFQLTIHTIREYPGIYGDGKTVLYRYM